tara:strand:- start:17671 stop:17781 length:111 start_codon:yes stop_codon:yes gene_type:complete
MLILDRNDDHIAILGQVFFCSPAGIAAKQGTIDEWH